MESNSPVDLPTAFVAGENPMQAWIDWKQKINSFLAANDIKIDDKMKISTLLAFIGKEGRSIHEKFEYVNEGDRDNYDVVLEKFDEVFKSKPSTMIERYKFYSIKQEKSDTFDHFFLNLLSQVGLCNFGKSQNNMMIDQILIGMRSDGLRKRLLDRSFLGPMSLMDVRNECRLHEQTVKDLKVIVSTYNSIYGPSKNCHRDDDRDREGETSRKRRHPGNNQRNGKKKGNKKKSAERHLETSSREEGLGKPIEETNIGYAMLRKMGYQPGSGIGKEGTGRKDPLKINVKAGRYGLGREEQAIAFKHQLKVFPNLVSKQEFRSRCNEKMRAKKMRSDLDKCIRILRNLENEMGDNLSSEDTIIDESESLPESLEDNDMVEENSELPSTSYARFYDHEEQEEHDELEEQGEQKEHEEQEEKNVATQFEQVTDCLRTVHHYCLWCGCQYPNEDQLLAECPGPSEQDH